MEFQQFHFGYVIKLDPGEEVIAALRGFVDRQGIRAGYFQAIGAFSRVRLRFFDVVENRYLDHELDQQVEVVSLLGSIARNDGGPVLHVHATVSDAGGRTHSGHLGEGTVRPTLEVFLMTLGGVLRRRRDAETGLELLALPQAVQVR